jgi:glycosyltransferase involved in cell wall biosynthesis
MEDKDFLERNYRLMNVAYLTNGIDISRLMTKVDESRENLRKRLGLPANYFLFVTAARFEFQKGYDILVKAISKIKDTLEKTDTHCLFVLVGDGAELDEMRELSENLSVSAYIRFMGARTNVYDIIRAGDIFLLPSRWEGLPIVLLETGLLKVPVIASDTYGNREIVKQCNGILFKNQDIDALARTISDVLFHREKYDLAAYTENLYNEIQANYNLDKVLSGLRNIYCSFLPRGDNENTGV